jgi:2-keto-3-deoxy-L-rhamnonate aldolase RhmA
MRKSKVMAKIRAGKFARICALGHYLPFFVRHAAQFRYDGIWLDLEHRAMDQREVQSLLSICYYNDIDAMVRPPTLVIHGYGDAMAPLSDATAYVAKHHARFVGLKAVTSRCS